MLRFSHTRKTCISFVLLYAEPAQHRVLFILPAVLEVLARDQILRKIVRGMVPHRNGPAAAAAGRPVFAGLTFRVVRHKIADAEVHKASSMRMSSSLSITIVFFPFLRFDALYLIDSASQRFIFGSGPFCATPMRRRVFSCRIRLCHIECPRYPTCISSLIWHGRIRYRFFS